MDQLPRSSRPTTRNHRGFLADEAPIAGMNEVEAQILAFPRPRVSPELIAPEITSSDSLAAEITAADVLALVGHMKTRREAIDEVVVSMDSFFELPPISGDDRPYYSSPVPRERRAIEISRSLDPSMDGTTVAHAAHRTLALAGAAAASQHGAGHLAPVIPIR